MNSRRCTPDRDQPQRLPSTARHVGPGGLGSNWFFGVAAGVLLIAGAWSGQAQAQNARPQVARTEVSSTAPLDAGDRRERPHIRTPADPINRLAGNVVR